MKNHPLVSDNFVIVNFDRLEEALAMIEDLERKLDAIEASIKDRRDKRR